MSDGTPDLSSATRYQLDPPPLSGECYYLLPDDTVYIQRRTGGPIEPATIVTASVVRDMMVPTPE